ncbi:uncharacterized protein SPSK_08089 [Sporothrix schenckii 1099-18]|uniref:Uncharacterized protein n=1 Tax=Sporothrix schenckii 1099-18 TaxID=1397361 RepID=A0A0F2MJH9_SPOSC|nr:uncharacterized protein SPSK_08089 [Sporothrix schenckii 1099-18]KJR88980.1 hypothetical protein SPSK_08089 [Sporothrix schenckii 1099-18]
MDRPYRSKIYGIFDTYKSLQTVCESLGPALEQRLDTARCGGLSGLSTLIPDTRQSLKGFSAQVSGTGISPLLKPVWKPLASWLAPKPTEPAAHMPTHGPEQRAWKAAPSKNGICRQSAGTFLSRANPHSAQHHLLFFSGQRSKTRPN